MMTVDIAKDRIEVLAEPGPYRLRSDQRRRARLLSEHMRRRGDPSPGGSTRRRSSRRRRANSAMLLSLSLSRGLGGVNSVENVHPTACANLTQCDSVIFCAPRSTRDT